MMVIVVVMSHTDAINGYIRVIGFNPSKQLGLAPVRT
jgi:hypothetical protein